MTNPPATIYQGLQLQASHFFCRVELAAISVETEGAFTGDLHGGALVKCYGGRPTYYADNITVCLIKVTGVTPRIACEDYPDEDFIGSSLVVGVYTSCTTTSSNAWRIAVIGGTKDSSDPPYTDWVSYTPLFSGIVACS